MTTDPAANPPSTPTITVPIAAPPVQSTVGRVLFALVIFSSFVLNLFFCILMGLFGSSDKDEDAYPEKTLYGPKDVGDKIAVIRVHGPLVEGFIGYPLKQIEKAMKDDRVKAVVVRIDSPGGTISASEDLHKHLSRLRDGKSPRLPDAKPKKLVASFGSIAASGGYYIAMPAEQVFAERTTITGSIGVFAALPNVAELAEKTGFRMELIKAGAIKASGSPFHTLTPAERQPWQDMVDDAYDRFLDVVAAGRPKLTKAVLTQDVLLERTVPLYDHKGNVRGRWWLFPLRTAYTRVRADGGTFTAEQARRFGLVDTIGDLDDAVAAAAASAGLGTYRTVVYDRPPSLLTGLLGLKTEGGPVLSHAGLAAGLTPRLWYLAAGADLAGIVAASGQE